MAAARYSGIRLWRLGRVLRRCGVRLRGVDYATAGLGRWNWDRVYEGRLGRPHGTGDGFSAGWSGEGEGRNWMGDMEMGVWDEVTQVR